MSIDKLTNVLASHGGYETVMVDNSEAQISLKGRVQKDWLPKWQTVTAFLLKIQNNGLYVDVSKQYFLDDQGKQRYTWRLIFQSENIEKQIDQICKAIVSAPNPRPRRMTEVVLHGVSKNRNMPTNPRARGAYPIKGGR